MIMKKKLYNCPSTEVMLIEASIGVCQVVSMTFKPTTPIPDDPDHGI